MKNQSFQFKPAPYTVADNSGGGSRYPVQLFYNFQLGAWDENYDLTFSLMRRGRNIVIVLKVNVADRPNTTMDKSYPYQPKLHWEIDFGRSGTPDDITFQHIARSTKQRLVDAGTHYKKPVSAELLAEVEKIMLFMVIDVAKLFREMD